MRQSQRTQEQLTHSVLGEPGTDETNGESASSATRLKVRYVTAMVRPSGEEGNAKNNDLCELILASRAHSQEPVSRESRGERKRRDAQRELYGSPKQVTATKAPYPCLLSKLQKKPVKEQSKSER